MKNVTFVISSLWIVFLLILLPACPFGRRALKFELKQSYTFADLEREMPHLDEHSLVIFDIDDTLIQGIAFMTREEREAFNSQFIQLQCAASSPEERRELRHKMYKILPVLIDKYAPQLIQTLQARNIPVIGLTSCNNRPQRGRTIEDLVNYRIAQLKLVGIDFSRSFPNLKPMRFSEFARGDWAPIYKDGIMFNAPLDKREALLEFMRRAHLDPNTIVGYDNDPDNDELIIAAAREKNSSCLAVEYLGGTRMPPFDADLYGFKVDYLRHYDVWLDDDIARSLMKRH